MLKRLQQKWNVSTTQFILILCVFAITGTTTAWISKAITSWVGFTDETYWLWKVLLRLSILIFGYQAILLPVAFLFGQFPFFWKYEKKILKRLGIPVAQTVDHAVPIAVFASGTGTNAQKIIDFFRRHPTISVALIVSNKPGAGVLKIAEKENIQTLIVAKERFFTGNGYVDELKNNGIQWIILAGFLWKIPRQLLKAFPNRIINIHPALLPKYGGKGMYGHFVHEAVLAAEDKETGITIHYVDDQFDHGAPIVQKSCPVDPNDTPESLAIKVQALEHQYYPEVIESVIEGRI